MSYEGHEQILCERGHYSELDAHDESIWNWRCHCGAGMAWTNSVDETNGIDEETSEFPGYVELEVATPAVMCTCADCGHTHTKEEATYKIPDKGIGCHHMIEESEE